ncbi:MAG: hypothetical protein C5S40_05555 [ANME-2 cluster archaeon]|nr:hypothetical protein [ANME-2 cluster archaeon]
MKRCTFYIVDVFAEEKYACNQLAVVRGAKALPDIEMQQIAKEINFSEQAVPKSQTLDSATLCPGHIGVCINI